MDETMAYQGSESQEIGRSSGLKGEDEWSENLWKELDSSRIDAYEKLREIVRRGEIVWRGWESPLRRTDEISLEPEFGDYTTLIGKAMPAVKESDVSEEFKVQLVIYVSPHFLKVHYAAAGGHYAAVHYWLCLGAYGTGTIGGVPLPNQGPFKCIMVGDGGTGKTIYVKRKLMGEFEKEYEPTMGMHKHMLEFPTKQGSTQFLCVDTPGHEKPGTLRDSYYEGADCCIIFYDITVKQTQKDVSMWHEDVHRVCGDIPMVACGNKVDLKKRQVKTKKVTFHMKKKLQYYEISAKSGYNLDSPFQYLAEKLAA